VKLFHRLAFFILAGLCLPGCGGYMASNQATSAPASAGPGVADVMRVGDRITIRLQGVPDDGYIKEYEIPTSGQVFVPLIDHPFQALGKSTGDLAIEIAEAYKTQQIYTTPDVTVIPEERYVNVGGEVRNPSRVVYTPDLTLLSAINSCGGFTDYAKRNEVRILRGKQVIYVDAAAASRTPGADPALYAGDQIYVQRTIF
jgi:polysaccharide export outer membrane protein